MAAPAAGVGPELGRALGLCLRELNRRDQTVAQTRRRLERAGTAPATTEAALAWLIDRRYLDDLGYAERYADDRRRLDGWAGERIRRRLEELGIEAELIDAAVGGREGETELEAALAVLAGRLTGASGADRDRRRALGLLARRGYERELAEAAVERHFGPSGG
ncbi:MAG: regulatory protein RecX [Solirubrobacteraceae bacterium]